MAKEDSLPVDMEYSRSAIRIVNKMGDEKDKDYTASGTSSHSVSMTPMIMLQHPAITKKMEAEGFSTADIPDIMAFIKDLAEDVGKVACIALDLLPNNEFVVYYDVPDGCRIKVSISKEVDIPVLTTSECC